MLIDLVWCCYTIGILHPLSYTAYLGQPDREVFKCLLWGQRFVRWTINGEVLSEDMSAARGIVMTLSSTRNPTLSGLIIPATATNSDGITVQCVAISVPTDIYVTSQESGLFRVQGCNNY